MRAGHPPSVEEGETEFPSPTSAEGRSKSTTSSPSPPTFFFSKEPHTSSPEGALSLLATGRSLYPSLAYRLPFPKSTKIRH